MQSNIANRSGNSYTAWREVTPLHNKLVERILQCEMHVAVTMRTKVEYSIEENERGKKTPRKIGMAPIFRDGIEYEFSVFFDVGQDHTSNTSKDRTGIFDSLYFKIAPETGAKLYAWLSGGDMTEHVPPMLNTPASTPTDSGSPDAPPFTLSARVDAAMKAHCNGMSKEQKDVVAAKLKQIAGTANYKAVKDEATLEKILREFEKKDDEVNNHD